MNEDQDKILRQLQHDIKVIKFESHVQTIAVVLAFIGITSLLQLYKNIKK